MLQKFKELLAEVPDASGSILAWEYFDQEVVNEIPVESAAFVNRGDHHMATVGFSWMKEENDRKCRDWARYIGGEMDKELEKCGGVEKKTAVYVNNVECEFPSFLPFFLSFLSVRYL